MVLRSLIVHLGILLFCAIVLPSGAAFAQAPKTTAERGVGDFPDISVDKSGLKGRRAIRALGPRLAEVAAWYGKTEIAFQNELLRDPELRIDATARLYASGRSQRGKLRALASNAAAIKPLNKTFQLHSNPGAQKIILLSFSGADISGSRWNSARLGSVPVPAFSLDGSPSFTDQELAIIQQIWQRVSEDFAPFDVNVTTEAMPLEQLNGKGTEVVVTTAVASLCKCGYLAYVDSFGSWAQAPVLVFASHLNRGHTKAVAETVSHALGRALGLGADGVGNRNTRYGGHGSGAEGWAPIMGNGGLREVTQFSDGSYTNASNKEDDFAVIQHHIPLREDDVGNEASAATVLPTFASNGHATGSAAGVLERSRDIDVFSIEAAAGTISATLTGAPHGSNTDLELRLLGQSGFEARNAPLNQRGASITAAVDGGTYFLHVMADSSARGSPGYGNVGNYRLVVEYKVVSNTPPAAAFSASPIAGKAPLSVTFDASASTDDKAIASYTWQVSGVNTDNADLLGKSVNQVFATAGDYLVTLVVTDNEGLSDTASRTIRVRDADLPPTAAFLPSLTVGFPQTLTFNARASLDDLGISSYTWDFGDSDPPFTTSESSVTRRYARPGDYEVTLTVTDTAGQTASVSRMITVTPPPPPALELVNAAVRISGSAQTGFTASAKVTVHDDSGRPVGGATVSGSWARRGAGGIPDVLTTQTDDSGIAIFNLWSSNICEGFVAIDATKEGFISSRGSKSDLNCSRNIPFPLPF